jgi:class 3 adenylate cyclase
MAGKLKDKIQECIILFADIIDSSKYSAVLGIEQYCDYILKFQSLFNQLAEQYFPKMGHEDDFSNVRVYGDEGAVFFISHSFSKEKAVLQMIQFAFELKARMELEFYPVERADFVSQKMEIGVGIHFGKVALISASPAGILEISGTDNPTKIERVEGYSINYAKRVESASREGKYSKILVSSEIASLIKNKPVILIPMTSTLKGISPAEPLYEIRSGFFRNIPLKNDSIEHEKFIHHYSEKSSRLDLVRKPWLKSFVASVINSQIVRQQFTAQKIKYAKKLDQFAWSDPAEDDPILLYIRALNMKNLGNVSKRFDILKDIISKFPSFNSARKEYVKAYWGFVKQNSNKTDLEIIHNLIDDYLNYFPSLLRNEEISELQKIMDEVKALLQSPAGGGTGC